MTEDKQTPPIKKLTKVDEFRILILTFAELVDAWRIVPRTVVTAYGYMCWEVVKWYTSLEPKMIPGCDMIFEQLRDNIDKCITDAPSTQHTAFVTAIVGAAAAVFALYANTGRHWESAKFVKWDETHTQQGRPHSDDYAISKNNDIDQYGYDQFRTKNRRKPSSRNNQRDDNIAEADHSPPDDSFWEDTER